MTKALSHRAMITNERISVNNSFVFSSDLADWMPSFREANERYKVESQRKRDEKKLKAQWRNR